MIRLLHTADLHLDWAFPSYPANRRALRRREIIGVFYQLISLAIEHNVQAVLIAGDLFESELPSQEVRSAVTAGFTRLADHGVPVFLAPGHVEAHTGVYDRLDLPGNVCLVGGDEPNASHLLPMLTVYGFPTGFDRDFRPLQGFEPLDRPGIHLGILHGTYQGLPNKPEEDNWLPIWPEDAARSKLDYLALGHYHEHFTAIHGETHLAYPGTPARLGFGQAQERCALLVSFGEGAPAIERLPLRDRPYLEFDFDLSVVSIEEVLDELDRRQDPEACVRVILHGAILDGLDFFAERVLARHTGSFFYLEAADRTEIALPASGDTIQDAFIRRCQNSLREKDLSTADRAALEYALRAGLIALRGGRL
ncbi:MAG: metallophosphoesterase family protein [Bacteroidota bacterium]